MTESAEQALASELDLRDDQLARMLDYCALQRSIDRSRLVEQALQYVRRGIPEATFSGLCDVAKSQDLDPDEFVAANVLFAVARWISQQQQKRTR